MNTPSTAQPENNACDLLLHDLNKGAVRRELNEQFAQLIQGVRKHGKPGELTLKLRISPANGGDASRVNITGAVTTKAPANAPKAGIYFTTEEGGLSKNDPEQEEFRFRTVAASAEAPAPAPEISTPTQAIQ